MENRQNGVVLLTALKDTLKREKEALMANDSIAFDNIVTEKQDFLGRLEEASFEGCNRVAIEQEVLEIKELQECNLLLTKQAISFHDSILDALTDGMEKKSRTYSKKGQLSPSKNVGLFNQSV
ncbi:hypothetical protein [Trichococcus pasteurii]|uniref:Flgn protein n=1 Tax=Trichococcus pasteurii TaxID=43064 RepID=A0A1W1IIS2_9LACT|nr:hypothetical protein [Trichococcus pasteurii]SFE78823.1 hypothetical protein SAMN04488086_11096 [Trichococcus pasteurii]SLM52835.1 flgn protein [Trichococcus pasteurii]SSB93716.1 flgn protein [Trichococcus pasteurii]